MGNSISENSKRSYGSIQPPSSSSGGFSSKYSGKSAVDTTPGYADLSPLDKLIVLLSDGNFNERDQAAGALLNLATDERYQIAIVKAGGIQPLISLLTLGRDQGKILAAGTIWNLSKCHENKILLADAGAIIPLINLLDSGSEIGKQQAAGALNGISLNNKHNTDLVVASGAIPHLVALARSGETVAAQRCALSALQTLAVNADHRRLIEYEDSIYNGSPLLSCMRVLETFFNCWKPTEIIRE